MMPRGIRYQAAILDGHNVLLIRIRPESGGEEIWIFPGGGRESGESEEDCVAREVREETHLDVAVESLLFETSVTGDAIYTLLKTYRCRVRRSGVSSQKAADGRWQAVERSCDLAAPLSCAVTAPAQTGFAKRFE